MRFASPMDPRQECGHPRELMQPSRSWAALAVLGIACLGASGCVRSVEARGQNWWSARTAHVHLETDTGRERAIALAVRLERQVQVIRSAFYRCALDDRQPVEVTVLAREDEADSLLRDEEIAGRSMGPVDGLLALPPRLLFADYAIRNDGEGRRLLSHEITHHFVDACFHDAPTWLHEGLATVFETAYVAGENVVIGRAPYRVTQGAMTWRDSTPGLEVVTVPRFFVLPPSILVGLTSERFYHPVTVGLQSGVHVLGAATARQGNYASAFALVHYLALGPDPVVRTRFVAYLSALSQGTATSEAAFAETLGAADLDARVDAYAAEGHFGVTRRPLLSSDASAIELAPVSEARAHLRLAELELSAGGDGAASAARVHLAFAAAAPATRPEALLVRAAFASPRRAVALVRTAERIAPESRDVLRAAVLVAQQEGQPELAATLAARLATAPDLRAADFVVLAEVERVQGSLDRALEHARLAVVTDRGWWPSWLALARVSRDREDWRTARAALVLVENLAGRTSMPAVSEAREWIAAIDGAVVPPAYYVEGPAVAPASPVMEDDTIP
jgi:hypothetical protein